MTSLFDVIDFDDRNDRTSSRVALALAHKKVGERFDVFLNQRVASADYTARMELIQDDFRDTVREACEQIGYTDVDGIVHTLWNERLTHATGSSRTASADGDGFDKEARRPKLCPYHSEVIDASLAAGDAQAGYHAYAQHAWTDKHCKGDEYEGGRCSFKPEMTTTSYWEEKAEKAEERKLERQQQAEDQQAEETQVEPIAEETEPVEDFETPEVTEISETPDSDAPEGGEVAEPEAGLAHDELMAVAASVGRFAPLAAAPVVDPRDPANLGNQSAPAPIPPQVPGQLQQPQLAPAAPLPQQLQTLQPQSQPGAPVTQDLTQLQQQYQHLQPRTVAAVKEAEAVERQKVTDVPESLPAGNAPHRWRTNLKPVDTEGEGSRNPTRRKDPVPGINEEKPVNGDALKEIGEQVTEHQDIEQDSGFNGSKANEKTWSGGSPSAVDS